jgi:hypothetical protein
MNKISSFVVCLIMAIGLIAVAGTIVRAEDAGAETDFRIEVRGLRIAGEGYENEQSMRPFNWSYGTTVVLLVRAGVGNIIDFDDDNSEIKMARDDRGTDLLKSSGKGMNSRPDFGSFPNISSDRKACLIDLKFPENPVSGAVKLECAGTLVFSCANEKESFEKKDVALKEKTEFRSGPLSFVISEVKRPDYQADKYPLSVTFQARKRFDTLEGVAFYDEAGREIESSSGGSSESRFMGSVTATRTYNLTKKVEKATIVFTFWKDWKKVPVPFSVTTSLGL